MAAKGVCLHHISRESSDVKRLSKFYNEILGFEKIESPDNGIYERIWMKLPPVFSLHLIERNPKTKLPEGPWSSTDAIADPKNLSRGHHICFAVSNYDSFVQTIKKSSPTHLRAAKDWISAGPHIDVLQKGIEVFEKTQPDGITKQAFFFDPDGNGLEVGSWEAPIKM